MAEVSLLAAFQNRAVGKKLVEALHMLMPGLKYFRYVLCCTFADTFRQQGFYPCLAAAGQLKTLSGCCSIGALLKDGVVVRTSNLAVEGPVAIEPRTLRGSAARVAARKHTTFHAQKRTEDETYDFCSMPFANIHQYCNQLCLTVLTVQCIACMSYAGIACC